MRRPARVASGREPPVGWRGLRATRGAPVRTRISRRVRPHWPVWRSRPPRAGAVASIRTWNPIRCRKLALAVYACPTLGIHVASKMGFGVLKGQCLMSPKEVGTVPTNTRARKCGDFGVKGTRLQMPLAPRIVVVCPDVVSPTKSRIALWIFGAAHTKKHAHARRCECGSGGGIKALATNLGAHVLACSCD